MQFPYYSVFSFRFFFGAAIAYTFGYTDEVSMTTIGGGAATYIVEPVTGASIGAKSDVIALRFAAGLVKAILVMVATPWIAKWIGLDNPRTAMIFGGLMGTTSGVAGGLEFAISQWGVWRAGGVSVPLSGSATASELESLRGWCRDRLSPYKIPKLLKMVAELPRNAMGKIVKTSVKTLFSRAISS